MEDNNKIEKSPIIQRFLLTTESEYETAERYYSLLSTINNLQLTQREVQLVAFTAIKGNISYASNKEEFCKKYDSTFATIGNLMSKLRKRGVFVKDQDKIKVNPIIVLDFKRNIILDVNVKNQRKNN